MEHINIRRQLVRATPRELPMVGPKEQEKLLHFKVFGLSENAFPNLIPSNSIMENVVNSMLIFL